MFSQVFDSEVLGVNYNAIPYVGEVILMNIPI